uniref:Uncharacterized protein n=1 Tax=Chromera velia CCMP2878 TaxID=1169474 RepID=A0A0G4G5A3_9ALVE|eukprot:Cvel_20355.t1-p1 / transcript=Cvel_20355.t1 / gene=Cvel_20355 / organism=Chromera_velia_CCMP2878 / gene_product=hypothetical protein / transcript_product=hypothetical protein / location=Cvel_scaffold1820:19225-21469(-) / protein_length=565 / sequence_SO=supercontig / SO=protein_coding / is_pseudo=false
MESRVPSCSCSSVTSSESDGAKAVAKFLQFGTPEGIMERISPAFSSFVHEEGCQLVLRNSFLSIRAKRQDYAVKRTRSLPAIPVSIRYNARGFRIPCVDGTEEASKTFLDTLANVGSLWHAPGGLCGNRRCFWFICNSCHYCLPDVGARRERIKYKRRRRAAPKRTALRLPIRGRASHSNPVLVRLDHYLQGSSMTWEMGFSFAPSFNRQSTDRSNSVWHLPDWTRSPTRTPKEKDEPTPTSTHTHASQRLLELTFFSSPGDRPLDPQTPQSTTATPTGDQSGWQNAHQQSERDRRVPPLFHPHTLTASSPQLPPETSDSQSSLETSAAAAIQLHSTGPAGKIVHNFSSPWEHQKGEGGRDTARFSFSFDQPFNHKLSGFASSTASTLSLSSPMGHRAFFPSDCASPSTVRGSVGPGPEQAPSPDHFSDLPFPLSLWTSPGRPPESASIHPGGNLSGRHSRDREMPPVRSQMMPSSSGQRGERGSEETQAEREGQMQKRKGSGPIAPGTEAYFQRRNVVGPFLAAMHEQRRKIAHGHSPKGWEALDGRMTQGESRTSAWQRDRAQ